MVEGCLCVAPSLRKGFVPGTFCFGYIGYRPPGPVQGSCSVFSEVLNFVFFCWLVYFGFLIWGGECQYPDQWKRRRTPKQCINRELLRLS